MEPKPNSRTLFSLIRGFTHSLRFRDVKAGDDPPQGCGDADMHDVMMHRLTLSLALHPRLDRQITLPKIARR